MKNYTIARKLDNFREIASRAIHDYVELHDHPYGRITITDVYVDHDYDFLDITVSAERDGASLAKFLAPLASKIRMMIG